MNKPTRFITILFESKADEDDLIHRAYSGSGRSSTPDPSDETIDAEDSDGEEERRPDEEADDPDVNARDLVVKPSDSEAVEDGLLSKFNNSKIVDFGLDFLGSVGGWVAAGVTAGSMGLGAPPAYVLAAVPDLINSIRHAARGDRVNAAIYFLCALPVIGEVLGPVKLSMKFLGTAARATDVYELIFKVRNLISGLRTLKSAKKPIGSIKDTVRKHFPDFDVDSVEKDAMVILGGSDDEVEELIRRSGHASDSEPGVKKAKSPKSEPVDPDYDVSTEANPLAESRRERRISIIFESTKPSSSKSSRSSSSKSSSKKQDPLPPIPTTPEFEREMRDVIAAHYAGEDIESWLTHDILGSKASSHGLSRKTGWTGDDDFYRKPSASYMAQHLAAHRDPEIRAIGQRVLRKMGDKMGQNRFSRMGSGFGFDPIENEDF